MCDLWEPFGMFGGWVYEYFWSQEWYSHFGMVILSSIQSWMVG